MRATHTFAELEVSDSTWSEIAQLLREAGYGHVFVDNKIEMNGIALVARKEPNVSRPRMPVSGYNESCQLCRDGLSHNYHTAPPVPDREVKR